MSRVALEDGECNGLVSADTSADVDAEKHF